jgi:hypothetical protein
MTPTASKRLRLAAATLSLAVAAAAQAGVDSIVTFSQPGQVDIYLTSNAGGFDHILEPVLVGGNAPFFAAVPSGLAWMVGTENGSPLSLVGDPEGPRTPTGFNYAWGTFGLVEAGQEISFRLTNVNSDRIGGTDPDAIGTIDSQLFTGSGAIHNTMFAGGSVAGGTPGAPDPNGPLPAGYTYVTFVSDTQIDIGFTDFDPNRPDPYMNMTVTLLLTPVPEPAPAALLAAGLLALVLRRRPAVPARSACGP